MRGTPYSKTCNKTCRRFYDDFDLLPPEMKKLLHEQDRMPTFEDLKAAWELAQETITLKDILERVRVLEFLDA